MRENAPFAYQRSSNNCCSFDMFNLIDILLRWSVQYAEAIGQYYKRLKGVIVVVGVGVVVGVYHE